MNWTEDARDRDAGFIELRPLRPGDLDEILTLERVLFGAGSWTRGMFRDEIDGWGRWYIVAERQLGASNGTVAERQLGASKSLVAERHRAIVGYAGLWFDGEISQVMTIGVAPNHQRHGIGAALLAALIEQSQLLGAEALFLEVRIDNDPAIRLYENFGFTQLGIRKRYYQPEDVDALTMRLVLRSDGLRADDVG